MSLSISISLTVMKRIVLGGRSSKQQAGYTSMYEDADINSDYLDNAIEYLSGEYESLLNELTAEELASEYMSDNDDESEFYVEKPSLLDMIKVFTFMKHIEDHRPVADRIASMFGNNGQCFLNDHGKSIDDVCIEFNGVKERARTIISPSGEATTIYHPEGEIVRYTFSDGSAIVITEGYWDFEGDEPFSCEGEQ